MKKSKCARGLFNRLDGANAILLLGEDEALEIAVPISWLPLGVKVGTVLRIRFDIDERDTGEGKDRVGGHLQ